MNAAQLEERRKGIGGTDISAIMGLNPWRSPYQVYLEKRGESAPAEETPIMNWGLRVEPIIRQWYSDTTGNVVRIPEKMLVHKDIPYLYASLDGFTDSGHVLEIKTARSGREWGEPGTAEIPDHYALQVQQYMLITGFDVADVAVSIGGGVPELYFVEADKEIHEIIIETAATFWQRVQEGSPPEPTCYADAKQRYGRSDAQAEIEATDDILSTVEELADLKAAIKNYEKSAAEREGKIIAFLGDRGDILTDHYGNKIVTYKLGKGRKSLDSKALQKEMPEVYERYCRTNEPSRRFLLK